jgi:hypothetical protein
VNTLTSVLWCQWTSESKALPTFRLSTPASPMNAYGMDTSPRLESSSPARPHSPCLHTTRSVEFKTRFSGEYSLHILTETSRACVDTTINSNTIRRRLVDDGFKRSFGRVDTMESNLKALDARMVMKMKKIRMLQHSPEKIRNRIPNTIQRYDMIF